MGLKLEALSQPAYLDALWLTSLTKAELFDLDDRRLWTISASFYGENIRTGLVSLLLAPDLAEPDGGARRRGSMPSPRSMDSGGREPRRDSQRSSPGRRSVSAPGERSPFRDARASRGEGPRLSCRGALGKEPTRHAIAPAASLAAERGDLRRSFHPLGLDALSLYFLHHEMVDWPPDRILLGAREAVSAASSRMTEVALESLADRDLPALLAGDALSETPAEDVAASEARARGFLGADAANGEIPDGAIPVRLIPPYVPRSGLRSSLAAGVARPDQGSFGSLERRRPGERAGNRARDSLRGGRGLSALRPSIGIGESCSGGSFARGRRAKDCGRGSCGESSSEGTPKAIAELRLLQLHRDLLENLRLESAVSLHAFDGSLAAVERALPRSRISLARSERRRKRSARRSTQAPEALPSGGSSSKSSKRTTFDRDRFRRPRSWKRRFSRKARFRSACCA